MDESVYENITYTAEDKIDFFAELNKLVEDEVGDDDNKCLITYEPLTDKYVTLDCGHKFNYIPLYNDILNHKKKFNILEGQNKLSVSDIRCPYCRKKHNKLLPYYEELGLDKINGVNVISSKDKSYYIGRLCEFKIPNESFDEDIPESETNPKFTICDMCFANKICSPDLKKSGEFTNYGDTGVYCYSHVKLMVRKHKADEREKDKQEKKEAKKQEKIMKCLEKEKAKQEAKKMEQNENVVLGPTDGCVQILKTGPNKGKYCGCKISNNDNNLCKRHAKMNENK